MQAYGPVVRDGRIRVANWHTKRYPRDPKLGEHNDEAKVRAMCPK